MKDTDEVAVFWDYENCPAPPNASGYAIVNNIRSVAQMFGSIKLFKAYLEVSQHVPVSRALLLRSELQSSGVSLTDCPHNGRKDVADKMILVDMLAYAIDKPAPSTIVLISGDRGFAYALSILSLRRYRIVLITLSNSHPSLRARASLCFDWVSDILGAVDTASLHQPTSPRRRKSSTPPASSDSKGHTPLRSPFKELYDEQSWSNEYLQDKTRCREISRTYPKHDPRHNFLPPDLEPPRRQPTALSTASNALRSGLEYSPVASPCHTYLIGSIEPPLTHGPSNSSQTTSTPYPSDGSTPKLSTYESIMASKLSAYNSPRGSFSLPNLVQHTFLNTTDPVSFESALQISPAEPNLRGYFPLSQLEGANALNNINTRNLWSVDDGGGDPDLPPTHSNIPPPPNVTTPLSSSLNHPTVSLIAQSPVKAANPPIEPTLSPAVPEIFKILVQCLQSHRSKGVFRPLRTHVAVEIARNGTTYRQAGVLRFGDYVALAEKAGIVELGGSGGTVWIALKEVV
ncbi:DUF537-domain-containing protein [Phlegmacium glaucopus]|nr:DUF537-domain-containing protein [Phlegmacium glaucopus]